jgi:hypothetical protein
VRVLLQRAAPELRPNRAHQALQVSTEVGLLAQMLDLQGCTDSTATFSVAVYPGTYKVPAAGIKCG